MRRPWNTTPDGDVLFCCNLHFCCAHLMNYPFIHHLPFIAFAQCTDRLSWVLCIKVKCMELLFVFKCFRLRHIFSASDRSEEERERKLVSHMRFIRGPFLPLHYYFYFLTIQNKETENSQSHAACMRLVCLSACKMMNKKNNYSGTH